VHDLVIHPDEKDLVIGTHGRSFWILDDLTPLHQWSAENANKRLHAYAPRHAYRVSGGAWYHPEMNVGENAPNGVLLHYALKDTTNAELTLVIRTERGDTVARFSSNKDRKGEEFKIDRSFRKDSLHRASGEQLTRFKGLNKFTWDMEWPPAESFDGQLLWGGSTSGPTAVPGWYSATFTLGTTDSQTVRFEIRKDPRVSATQADFDAQFAFVNDVQNKLSSIHKNVKRIREIRSQVNGVAARYKDLDTALTTTARDLAKQITDTLDAVENELVQTKAKAFQDLLNYPVKLNNKIASLAGVAASADTRPTKQVTDLYAKLSAQADYQLGRVTAVEREQIAKFNAAVAALALPAVKPPKDVK
jgi:archaellum component FlaC